MANGLPGIRQLRLNAASVADFILMAGAIASAPPALYIPSIPIKENRKGAMVIKRIDDKIFAYFVDVIQIHTSAETNPIKKMILKLKDRKSHCNGFWANKAEKPFRRGYPSMIRFWQPDEELFKIISPHIPSEHFISEIEIACDVYFPGADRDAISSIVDVFGHIVRRKDNYQYFKYDHRKKDRYFDPNNGHHCFTPIMHYYGPKENQFVVYGSYSKILDGKPVLHMEWRFNDINIIERNTQFRNIDDLISADLSSIFDRLTTNKMELCDWSIDKKKLGKAAYPTKIFGQNINHTVLGIGLLHSWLGILIRRKRTNAISPFDVIDNQGIITPNDFLGAFCELKSDIEYQKAVNFAGHLDFIPIYNRLTNSQYRLVLQKPYTFVDIHERFKSPTIPVFTNKIAEISNLKYSRMES